MKSQLKKLKGTSLKTQIGDLILRQPFRVDESDFDQIYFYTHLENTICKLYDLDRDISVQRFENEKHNYEASGLSMLAQIICAEEFKNKKKTYGYFIINKIQKQSSILQKSPNLQQILILAKKLIQQIVQMKKKRQIMLNFRPQNIVRDTNNLYVLLQPTYVTACAENVKITRQKLETLHHFLFENIEKQFKYYSPELLDNYFHGQIDYHSDMFVIGCILYEVLTSSYPFQSRLSILNLQPHRKFQQIQNSTLRVIISMLLKPPGYRPQPQQLLTIISQHETIKKKNSTHSDRQIHSDQQVEDFQFFKENNNQIHRVQSTNGVNKVDTTFLDGIKSVFNRYKNSSQGWFLNFTQNNNSNPLNQYMESCLAKLYKKSDKIDKLSTIIKKHIFNANGSVHYFLLKSLIFIGNLLRKGPPTVFDHSKIWLQILQNIISMNLVSSTSGLISDMIKILKHKLQVNNKVKSCFQGNFYLINCALFKAVKLEHLTLLSEYLKSLLGSLNSTIQQRKIQLYQIVLTWICDQLYDLISVLTLSVISIRKDNQLKLRTDNLDSLRPIQRNINAALKKMSSFAGQMNFHPIYELQSDYSFYQQEIFLKQSPQSTTFQHFYRSAKMYKGLRVPINYLQYYTMTKSFDSGDISNTYQQKTYAQYNQIQVNKNPFSKSDQFESDPQLDQTIKVNQDKHKQRISLQFKEIISTKTKVKADQTFKVLFNLDLNPKSNKKITYPSQSQKNIQPAQNQQNNNQPKNQSEKNNIWPSFQQFNCPKQQKSNSNSAIPQKKTITTNLSNNNNIFDMFNMQQKNATVHEAPKKNIEDFNFFQNAKEGKKLQHKKMASSEIFTIQTLSKAIQQGPKKNTKNSNTTHHENNFKKQQKKQQNNIKQVNKFPDFGFFPEKVPNKPSNQQQPSKDKVKQSQVTFGVDFYQDDFFKKNIPKKQKKQETQQNPLLKAVQAGLKLHQLKQLLKSNSKIIINFADIKIQKTIGSGSAGQVYLGQYNKQVVAVKKVKTKQNPNALKQFERQLVTYIKMKRHPNLVSLVGLCKSQQDYYLLTQYCSYGSLFDLLHKKANTIFLSWAQRTKMALQIATGMYALHTMKPIIIHRDLKSLNVFVTQKNGQFMAKVADFGLSRSPEAEMMTSALGTLHWMAPQLLENKQYSFKVDVYSYGILLWQICARKTPYHTLTSPMAIIKYVTMDQKRPGLQFIGAECPSALVMLMQKCWAHEPNQRPTFQNIIKVLQSIIA